MKIPNQGSKEWKMSVPDFPYRPLGDVWIRVLYLGLLQDRILIWKELCSFVVLFLLYFVSLKILRVQDTASSWCCLHAWWSLLLLRSSGSHRQHLITTNTCNVSFLSPPSHKTLASEESGICFPDIYKSPAAAWRHQAGWQTLDRDQVGSRWAGKLLRGPRGARSL